MPIKNPAILQTAVLRNGGQIQTEAGTAIISVSEAGVVTQTVVKTDDGQTGAQFVGYHDSASPAQGDLVTGLLGTGNNDAAEAALYGSLNIGVWDPSDGAEYGVLGFHVSENGSNARAAFLVVDGGVTNFILGTTSSPNTVLSTDSGGDLTIDPDGPGGLYMLNNAMNGGGFAYQSYSCVYDFSNDGGTQGAIIPTITATVPDNFVATAINYDVLTTFTSATDAATVALGFATDGDIFTTAAISDGSNPLDAGVHGVNGIPVKTTAARQLQITVAGGEDLTAGKAVFTVIGYTTE